MSNQDLPLFQQNQNNESVQAHSVAMSVSEITAKIKSNLEGEFTEVWVKGEISNLKVASSGHVYFSLKDDGANLTAAAFGWGRKKKPAFDLKDGLEVLCRGNISVYAPRGNYNLHVDVIEPIGGGSLQLAVSQ